MGNLYISINTPDFRTQFSEVAIFLFDDGLPQQTALLAPCSRAHRAPCTLILHSDWCRYLLLRTFYTPLACVPIGFDSSAVRSRTLLSTAIDAQTRSQDAGYDVYDKTGADTDKGRDA